MNYTIEEKLREIPIACVREKALESWGKLNDEQKSRNEADFINSLGRLSDAVEILHEFSSRFSCIVPVHLLSAVISRVLDDERQHTFFSSSATHEHLSSPTLYPSGH